MISHRFLTISWLLQDLIYLKENYFIVRFFIPKIRYGIVMVELSLNFNVPEGVFSITDAAANRIKELIELDGRSNAALEIKVVPGGCAGFSYEMGWAPLDKDGKKFEKDGAAVLIAETDMRLLDKAELDFVSSY